MTDIDIIISKIEEKFPEFLSPKDVEDFHLVSQQSLHKLRRNGQGPSFIKIPGSRIKYPTGSFTSWLKKHYHACIDEEFAAVA